jgi:hypothetical protein
MSSLVKQADFASALQGHQATQAARTEATEGARQMISEAVLTGSPAHVPHFSDR